MVESILYKHGTWLEIMSRFLITWQGSFLISDQMTSSYNSTNLEERGNCPDDLHELSFWIN